MTYMEALECPKCKKTYSPYKPHNLCTCGSPLLVSYNLSLAKKRVKRESFKDRPEHLWRYKELLPVVDEKNIVSLMEGWTPLFDIEKLGSSLGFKDLKMKDESFNPTGTFKARGASVGVSKAKELQLLELAMPTAGNAGGAWAAYSAKADIHIHIAMPLDAPEVTKKEVVISGADLYLVDGLISDAGEMISKAAQSYGWFEVSTLKEPYRIEGKKTMGFELIEQLNWRVPDVILYPCGGGVGIIGIWKAIKEMEEMGFIPRGKRPKMVAVQAEGCAPIVAAYNQKEKRAKFWERAETIAGGIRVPAALGDFLILESIYESGGASVSVSDHEILEAMKQVMCTEGVFISPEGAACVAALKELAERGVISSDDTTVVLNTGTGLKYVDLIEDA